MVGMMIAAFALTPEAPVGKKEEPHWIFGIAACWMLVFLPAFIIVHLASVRPIGRTRKSLVLGGASRKFVSAIADEIDRDAPGPV